jgi:plasmid stabilization system protein ParE
MAYRVRATPKAKRDLDGILQWLLEREAGAHGLRWFRGLRDAVASLAQMPRRCRLAPEDEVFPYEVRQLLYGNRPHLYRILFTIEADTVVILHIRHGRRLPLT